MSDKIKKAKELCGKIYACQKCDFHAEVRDKGSIYRPDYPPIINSDYKIMVIGINPGWSKKN